MKQTQPKWLPTSAPREALAKVVGQSCNLDDLLADIRDELRPRPYERVFVVGGWQLRTKSRYAGAIRELDNGANGRMALDPQS